MDNSVVVLGARTVMPQSLNGLAGVAVLEMGFGMFPPKPDTFDLLARKSSEDIFVPLIFDLSDGDQWKKEARITIAKKFPSAHVIISTEKDILSELDKIKESEALYPGIVRSHYVFKAIRYAFAHLGDIALSTRDLEREVGLSRRCSKRNSLLLPAIRPGIAL